jgi:hypothetical protein
MCSAVCPAPFCASLSACEHTAQRRIGERRALAAGTHDSSAASTYLHVDEHLADFGVAVLCGDVDRLVAYKAVNCR